MKSADVGVQISQHGQCRVGGFAWSLLLILLILASTLTLSPLVEGKILYIYNTLYAYNLYLYALHRNVLYFVSSIVVFYTFFLLFMAVASRPSLAH